MNFIDLFSGVGGFTRGLELAGHKCIGHCEFDKFAEASYRSMHIITDEQRQYLLTLPLKQRQKEILKDEYLNGEWYRSDIRAVRADDMPRADCWTFGAPCQDFSIAGKRAGLDGDRSSLVREVFRALEEWKEGDRPEWIIYENVKGMLSSNSGLDYLEILAEMDRLGYDVEWQNINSKWFVPQNRERIYTIGHLRARGRHQILPIEGTDGKNYIKLIGHKDGYRRNTQFFHPHGITETLDTATGGGRGHHTAQFIDLTAKSGGMLTDTARTLKARYTAGVTNRNGDNSGVAMIIDDQFRNKKHIPTNFSPTLRAQSHGNEPQMAIPVLTPDRAEKRQNGRRLKANGEEMFTLTAQDRHGIAIGGVYTGDSKEFNAGILEGASRALKSGLHDAGIAIDLKAGSSKTRGQPYRHSYAATLDHNCYQGILLEVNGGYAYAIWSDKYQCYLAIRKLTPKECFRLQGWTDAYFDKAKQFNSDSQLYKQAGNGVTVDVTQAVGEKLRETEELCGIDVSRLLSDLERMRRCHGRYLNTRELKTE